MGKMNVNAVVIEQGLPQDRHLFPLRNGIGGNKGNLDIRALNVLGGLEKPRGDIIQIARAFHVGKNKLHVPFLFRRLIIFPNKRRIPQNIRQIFRRNHRFPIGGQGIAMVDVGGFF